MTFSELQAWLSEVLEQSDFSIQEIPFSASQEWSFSQDGVLQHKTGRFFSIVGVSWEEDGTPLAQPFIAQPEVGQLGFLLRTSQSQPELLMYAKIEPGNVGGAQLAPTCQATDSNSARVHQGRPSPFAEWFIGNCPKPLAAQINSEQGTLFLHKVNRNVITLCQEEIELPATHRWMSVEEVCSFMNVDYLINTDSRSVLVGAPWETLIGRAPFTRQSTDWSSLLQNSFSTVAADRVQQSQAHLVRLRKNSYVLERFPLTELPGWQIEESRIVPDSGSGLSVRQVATHVRGREVDSWDQPLIACESPGQVDLVSVEYQGQLYFGLSAQREPGLLHGVEFGPTLVVNPLSLEPAQQWWADQCAVLAEVNQSDEGGRFFQTVSKYRLLHAGEVAEFPPQDGLTWLTLGELKWFLDRSGWTTNELRSAVSLLLVWL